MTILYLDYKTTEELWIAQGWIYWIREVTRKARPSR